MIRSCHILVLSHLWRKKGLGKLEKLDKAAQNYAVALSRRIVMTFFDLTNKISGVTLNSNLSDTFNNQFVCYDSGGRKMENLETLPRMRAATFSVEKGTEAAALMFEFPSSQNTIKATTVKCNH